MARDETRTRRSLTPPADIPARRVSQWRATQPDRSLRASWVQGQLKVRDIQPAIKLSTDFGESGDLSKAERLLKFHAGNVLGADPTDQDMKAE